MGTLSTAAEGTELTTLQEELRSRFDANGDGWLNAAERESMRKERVRPGRRRSRSRRGFQWPPEIVERFDTDGDGKLDRQEGQAAWATSRRRWEELQKEYDENGDDWLNEEEGLKLGEDIAAGKVKDVPFFLRRRFSRTVQGRVRWETFDLDNNGRLNTEELVAARATLKNPASDRVEVSPSRPLEAERRRRRRATPTAPPVADTAPADAAPADTAPADTAPAERIRKIRFSRRGGICDRAFSLVLSCATTDAEIRYTLDCTAPSATTGEVYREPISISRTTVVRAAAFKPGLAPRRAKTSTFVFLRDVLTQSSDGLPPVDAPYRWGTNVVDYGMDPDVVGEPRYKDSMIDALESIPSISLVLDPDDLFGERGIYAYARMDGRDAERPGSVEIFFADDRPGVRENCGVRIRGGFSRTSRNPKHAFRLFFRKQYGKGKLRYPIFGRDGAEAFDNIDLRCSQNYSWNLGGDVRGLFVRDQFSRDLQLAMGHPAARGAYYHLYLNGQYWGLYNACERPEASFGETYLGGAKDDFDVIKVDMSRGGVGATDGDVEAWTRLHELASAGLASRAAYERIQGNNPDGSPNPEFEKLLEVENLIDYMLVIFWAGNLDAPVTSFSGNRMPNNWYGMRNRNGADGFRFFIWDAEHTLLDVDADRTGPFSAGSRLRTSNPQWLWQQCLENEEFRVTVGDHIQRRFSEVLSTAAVTQRFQDLVRRIEKAVIGESARWGDVEDSASGPMTRDVEWRAEVNRILEDYMPQRGAVVLSQLWQQGLISEISTPTLRRLGATGSVTDAATDSVTLDAARGVIYFTGDGSDPRQVGGAVSETAAVYREPLTIARGDTVKARALFEGDWSALILSGPR